MVNFHNVNNTNNFDFYVDKCDKCGHLAIMIYCNECNRKLCYNCFYGDELDIFSKRCIDCRKKENKEDICLI